MNRISKIFCLLSLSLASHAQTISTIAGNGIPGYSGDGGLASTCQLNNPGGMNFDKYGNLYVADAGNHVIRKISATGNISTIVGNGTPGFSGDGGPAISAQINAPAGICLDDSENIFIAEQQGQRIRKVDKFGIITTYAGTGTMGYNGDGIPATTAQVGTPSGVIADKFGNLYFTEFANQRIRKVNSAGIISTIAGTGTSGFNGDGGPAISAQLYYPYGITRDDSDNIYFADYGNNRFRKIDASGIITTIAGTGILGYSGDGGPALMANLNRPSTITIDKNGNIYISDWENHVIRKIDLFGIITTIAGNGTFGYSGDGGLATTAQLNYPFGVAVDTTCCLYISDYSNHVIRKVTDIVGVEEPRAASREPLNIYPNPCAGSFFISYNGRGKQLAIEIYNVYGQPVLNKLTEMVDKTEVKIENLPEGVYMIKLIIDGIQNKSQRIIVTK